MKKCPYCAEEIQEEAIVCRFCGRELAPEKVARVSDALTGPKKISDEQKSDSTDSRESTSKAPGAFTDAEVRDSEVPIWKNAFRLGGIFTLVYAIYLLSQLIQGRINSDRVLLDLTFGIVTWLVIGTIAGFVLVPLWRWNKWAPFALIAVVTAGTVGYASGLIDLSVFLPSRTPTPQEVTLLGESFNIDDPKFSTEQGGIMFYTFIADPDEDYSFFTAAERYHITPDPGEIVFKVSNKINEKEPWHSSVGAPIDQQRTRQFLCEAATITGNDCALTISYFEQALKNGFVNKDGIRIWVDTFGRCGGKFTEPQPAECVENIWMNFSRECCEEYWQEGQIVYLQFHSAASD